MLPCLLVPGLLSTAETFLPQLPALWTKGPVTIANTTGGTTISKIAETILDTAPDRFALAGHSMGGYIAFEIMRQAPQRVARLALLSTSARPDTPEQSEQRLRAVALARKIGLEKFLRQVPDTLVHPSRRGDPAAIARSVRMGMAIGIEGFRHQQDAIIARQDSRPTLADIDVPTLVLVGDKDPLTPPERAIEMANGIKGARLVTVETCGHASTFEQPEAVTKALMDWLDD